MFIFFIKFFSKERLGELTIENSELKKYMPKKRMRKIEKNAEVLEAIKNGEKEEIAPKKREKCVIS
jgi:hypothetical protein